MLFYTIFINFSLIYLNMIQFEFCVFLIILFSFNFCACFDITWNTYNQDILDGNREELIIKQLKTFDDFKLELNVTKWKSINMGSKSIAVGIMNHSIVLVHFTLNSNKTGFESEFKVIDLHSCIKDIQLIENYNNGVSEIILVVACNSRLVLNWYKLKDTTLTLFWTWTLKDKVTHFNILKINNKQKLIFTNERQNTTDIYEFELNTLQPKYWFSESIVLSDPNESCALVHFENDYFLNVPQKSLNALIIYKYENNRFSHYENISSYGINHVISFEIGFKSFIAIEGIESAIYQFTRNGLKKEFIRNSNLDGINFWMSIPVTIYRDEAILLAQRKLDHGTHVSFVIEVITYNGKYFEEHDDIPCSYYGEELGTLSCLADTEPKNGITEMAHINVGDKLAFLISDKINKSILFDVNMELNTISNPLKDRIIMLTEAKERIQNLLNKLEELKSYKLESTQSIRKIDVSSQDEPDSLNKNQFDNLKGKIDSLQQRVTSAQLQVNKISESENKSEFDTIIVNGFIEFSNAHFEALEVETIKGVPASDLLNDIVRKDNISKIHGLKTFTDITVNNLTVEEVNNINAQDLIYQTDSLITIEGDLTFNQKIDTVNVEILTEQLNGIILKNEVLQLNKENNDTLHFADVNVETSFTINKVNNLLLDKMVGNFNDIKRNIHHHVGTVFIPENITVENVNGENFDEFVSQLCLTNIICHVVGHVRVYGDVISKRYAHANYLNGLKFPREYVIANYTGPVIMTGKKHFKNLQAFELRTKGLVNDFDTKDLITLTTKQRIPKEIVFNELEVLEELKVHGNITGKHMDKFLQNPSLKDEVNEIKASVYFKKLIVEGNIVVSNSYNNFDFVAYMRDIIYRAQTFAIITGKKEFLEGVSVRKDLSINLNLINKVPIDLIVTKDTEQVLNMNTLNGEVNFENLYVSGLYGTCNITKMDEEFVKLTGDQFISSTLIFENEINVNNFQINNNLNGLRSKEFLYVNGDREINNEIIFNEIEVENLFIQNNLIGSVPKFDLDDLSNNALSYTKSQFINANYIINTINVDDIHISQINNIPYTELFEDAAISKRKFESDNFKQLKVKNLFVNGSIQLNKTNGVEVNKILPSNFNRNVEFEEDVHFDSIEIGNLSDVDFNYFINNIVFKNESDIVIDGNVFFSQDIKVEKLIETKSINDILIENIFTTYGNQEIVSPIMIHSNMYLDDFVAHNISGIYFEDFVKNLVLDGDILTVKGDVAFERLAHISNLTIHQLDDTNVDELLNNIVFTNVPQILYNDVIFENTVLIEGNLVVNSTVDNSNFFNKLAEVALITQDSEIQGLITFMQPVILRNYLNVENDFTTKYLFGIDLETWKNNAVYINKGFLHGVYQFEDVVVQDNLITKFINDLNMSTVIPLQTHQKISTLTFNEVYLLKEVDVKTVNGLILPLEVKNTIVSGSDQTVESEIVFQNNVLIRNNIITPRINNFEVEKIVTTNTNQNLSANYRFNMQVILESDLNINGSINEINVTSWEIDAMKSNSQNMQNIDQNWNITENLIIEKPVTGNGSLNGLYLEDIVKTMEDKLNNKLNVEQALMGDYKNLCQDIETLYQLSKQQIYKFRYFEDMQQIEFSNILQYVKYFKHNLKNYLLVNEYNNCFSHLYEFSKDKFHQISTIQTGEVSQIVSVYDDQLLYLVIRGHSEYSQCEINGTNVWKLADINNIELIYPFEQVKLLQESLVPGTFYGINNFGVNEFKIISHSDIIVKTFRKWNINEDNMDFVPRGLATGLAIRTGKKIFKLSRQETTVLDDIELNTEDIIIGNFTQEYNPYIPGRNGGYLRTVSVGKNNKRNLLAVVNHEENMKESLDYITIYSNPMNGKVFHKIFTNKPSNIVSLDFDNGETLLAFIENGKSLKVYEYKGINGFMHKTSAKIKGSELFEMSLPMSQYKNERAVIGVINENKINLLMSVMSGNQINDNLQCQLP